MSGSSPRVRGILCQAPDSGNSGGSSPRVRGIRRNHQLVRVGLRFIPAGAGNTKPPSKPAFFVSVHPRGCGEYIGFALFSLSSHGSSPRVRGIRGRGRSRGVRSRFIPAGAGNTLVRSTSISPPSVHPRGCGEYFRQEYLAEFVNGSSPRVRGIQTPYYCKRGQIRFIPAGAGNTL